ncbi:Fc receptor-like protein [Sarotherodon galilaeus]
MCSSLSTSRLILLISLSVMMLISVSGAEHVEKNCYKYSTQSTRTTFAPKWAKNIISCFKDDRRGCLPGYEVKTSGNRTFFLRPNTEWIKRKINEKTLLCPPQISK